MTIRSRALPGGGAHWQADIRVRLPDGRRHRERVKAPGRSRAAALRWARAREAHILRHGVEAAHGARAEIPTLTRFAERLRRDYIIADRLKPATRAGWDEILRLYLLPQLGRLRLDEIGAVEVQQLKQLPLAASTINTVLAKLKALLRKAVEWGVIETLPPVKPLPSRARVPEFYDFDAYARLIDVAAAAPPWTLVVILLGGDAGLRVGEMLALRWRDIDLERRSLTVVENEWRGHTGDPKGGATRTIPMTRGLADALARLDRAGPRVLDVAGPMYARKIDRALYRAQQRANLERRGPHVLRHTFCSHLAMKGAPARTIQTLAGHANSATTDRYMHLAPRTLNSAIELLDR
ncbi:MAG: site-specific integrase [Myxococcales bacterium]|nr:site-specific integrase [Myxococcales bacterium]